MSFNLFNLRKKQLANTVVTSRSATGAASATALSITQNGTVVMTINCGRTNYQGEILPAVTGLPTGVTAVILPTLLKRNVSNMTITFTATNVAPVVANDAFIVTLTSGLGVQTINCTMTVTASTETGTAPVLSAVTPSSGAVSTPTAITLTGTGFTSEATVTVNGVSATSVSFVNGTTITCTTPSLVAGVYDVTVTQASGVSTRPASFTSGALLIASFKASVDFAAIADPTVGKSFSVTKNGVRLYNKGTAQVWPVAHPTAPGITYEGGSHVFRINMSSSAANEIRFDNIPAVAELFTEWWMYQPSGTETPPVGIVPVSGSSDGSGNDKLFRLWSVSYTAGIKAGASYWHAAPGSAGYVGTEFTLYVAATNSLLGMGEGGSFYRTFPKQPQPNGFIGAAAYVGRWVRVRFRCKPATGPLDNNGIIQIWLDDALIVSRVDLPLYTNGTHPNSWTHGYIMGAKNSGGNGAQVYIDNVRFSTGGFS